MRFAEPRRGSSVAQPARTPAPFGSISDGVTVVADLPKKVEWDQPLIAAVVERIRAAGDDPSQYVDIAIKVPERKYGAWPDNIRAAFAPARTVKTGKQSFRLTHRRRGVDLEQAAGQPDPQGRAGIPSAPGHAPPPSHPSSSSIRSPTVPVRIITADERLSAANNKTSLAIFGPPGSGKTSC